MAFPIPEPYCWDESFKVFYDTLDEEHKGLFQGIFKCAANPADGGALGALAAAVKAHFTTEEGMMTKAGYADFTAHKALHEDFLATLATLSAPLSQANIDFAKNWLVQHIKGTDHKYKGKL